MCNQFHVDFRLSASGDTLDQVSLPLTCIVLHRNFRDDILLLLIQLLLFPARIKTADRIAVCGLTHHFYNTGFLHRTNHGRGNRHLLRCRLPL